MFARAEESSELSDELLSCAAALLSLLDEQQTSRQVYGAIDRAFQRCVERFERTVDTNVIDDYESDKRLFHLYTERIQRRVGYAKQELAEL